DMAEAQWRDAVKQVPEFRPGWQSLAEALRQQQKWDAAEILAREMLDRPRLVVIGLFLLGDAMHGRGRRHEACRAWAKILDLQPGHPEALERLAKLSTPKTLGAGP